MDPIKVLPPQESKLHFLDYWRIIRIRKTVILAVFTLVVVTATLVTLILPESYSSKARIKIERDSTDIPAFNDRTMPGVYDPYFIQTEFEVIQSEVILGEVIKKLNLNEEWGKKYAGGELLKTPETITMLKGRMELRPVRNTTLIEINVYSDNAQEAATIANAVAKAYLDHRTRKRQEMTQRGIEVLKEELREQEEKVSVAQSNVDELRDKLHIAGTAPEAATSQPMLTSDTLRRILGMRIEGDAELSKRETLLAKLKEFRTNDFEQLLEALPTAAPDTLLSSLLEQRTMAEQRLIMVRKDFGPMAPDFLKASDSVADLETRITNRVYGIMFGLEAAVDAYRADIDKLKQEVEAATQADISNANQSQPYWSAQLRLEELKRFRSMLELKISSEASDIALPKTMMVEIIDNAVPGTHPVKPNKPLNIALGIIIGLVVGVGLAFFIEYLDTSVKTIDDVERSLQAPVLGVIPQNVGLLVEEGAESPHAEAYRVLRTNLLFTRKDAKLNTVAVVSAGAGEGKSTTVFNLAAVFAQCGQRILIVDSDLRRPTLHKMLRVANNIGLTNYLLKQNSLDEVIQTTNLPSMDFMASGKLPSSSLGILSSGQMKELIGELKRRYDFVFFDSPPIMGVSDASILASEVDMTLQVIQYRRYPQPMNIRAKQLIEKVGGNLVGIVLNNINMSQDESYYYYSGYYHDYYSRNEDQEPSARPEEASGDKTKPGIKPKY